MIDSRLVKRLAILEQDRHRLAGEAAQYRLQAFDSIDGFMPRAAKVDAAMSVLRYAQKHWAMTGALLALAGIALRGRIGMVGLSQLALRLGSHYLTR